MTAIAPDATITDEPTGELARVQAALAKVSTGAISYTDLIKLIAPPPTMPVPPAEAPEVPAITDEQRAALDRVLEVFGVVVPDERRALTVPEIGSLVQERMTLDRIENLAKKRKEGIRTTVCNHLDVQIEEEARRAAEAGEPYEMPPRDEKGHYVADGKARAPGQPQQFSRETKSGGVSVDPEALRLLADEPNIHQSLLDAVGVDFTHDDYLAMTSPRRVLDENKVMLHLRTKPQLIHAIAAATTAAPRTASLCLRKA